MSGWVAIAALTVLAAVLLWRMKMPPLAVAVGLGVGLLGYWLTGSPMAKSVKAPPRAIDASIAPELEAARGRLLSNTGDIGGWLVFSETLIRHGNSQSAVEGLRLAVRAMPGSADLWVGLGNALVRHAEGNMTPAARLAFGRASVIDPMHPGPPYFLALAWLQAGEPDEALKVLQGLYDRAPANAPYRDEVERMMRGAKAMIAAGVDGGRFTPPNQR